MATTLGTKLLEAAVNSAILRLLWVGDSFVEGEGASTLANTFRMLVVAGLRSSKGISGAGLGLIPARAYATYLAASASWRTPNAGTATTAPNWNISQGLKGVRFTANGQYRESALPIGTACDVLYLQAGGAGGGNITIARSGTTVATINANDSGQPYQPSKAHRITYPSRAAHTIRATSGSTQGIVDGFVHYDGEDVTGGGIIAYDCSRTGAQSNVIAVDDILNGWDAILPHCIIDDQVGSNDFLDNARTPTAVVGFLNARLDKAASLSTAPTYIIVIPWRLPATAGTNGLGFTYENYITAVKNACASHAYAASIKVLDLNDVYPTAAAQPWHDADGLHPNNAGHIAISNAILSFINTLDAVQHAAEGTASIVSGASDTVTARLGAAGTNDVVSGASDIVTAKLVAEGTSAFVTTASDEVTSLLPTAGETVLTSSSSGEATSRLVASGEVTVLSATSDAVTARLVSGGEVNVVSGASGEAIIAGEFTGTAAIISGSEGSAGARLVISGIATITSGAEGSAEVVAGSQTYPAEGTAMIVSNASGSASILVTGGSWRLSNGTVVQPYTMVGGVLVAL